MINRNNIYGFITDPIYGYPGQGQWLPCDGSTVNMFNYPALLNTYYQMWNTQSNSGTYIIYNDTEQFLKLPNITSPNNTYGSYWIKSISDSFKYTEASSILSPIEIDLSLNESDTGLGSLIGHIANYSSSAFNNSNIIINFKLSNISISSFIVNNDNIPTFKPFLNYFYLNNIDIKPSSIKFIYFNGGAASQFYSNDNQPKYLYRSNIYNLNQESITCQLSGRTPDEKVCCIRCWKSADIFLMISMEMNLLKNFPQTLLHIDIYIYF